MTVKLPQKAGFVATTAEWDALVRIAENLAAQLVQRDAESLKATFDAHEKINQLSGDLYGAQMALAQAQAERDAARDELRVLRGIAEDTEGWAALFGTASRDALLIEATIKGLRAIHAGSVEALDAARAEAVRLTAALETYAEARDMVLKALPAVAINESEELWGASNTALVRKALSFLWHCAALRGQPAPAQGQE